MPFVKGQSGNPAGRPVGSRNRFAQEMDEAFEEEGRGLLQNLVSLARDGNPVALRLCVDRLVPVRKHRVFEIRLPSPDTPNYTMTALGEVHRALCQGEITTEEATRLLGFVERTARMVESLWIAQNYHARLERLEETMAEWQILPRAARMHGLELKGPAPQSTERPSDEAAIVNNNAETIAAAAAAATPEGQPIVNNNENTMATAPDNEHLPRRNATLDDLMSSTNPLAQMVERNPALSAGAE